MGGVMRNWRIAHHVFTCGLCSISIQSYMNEEATGDTEVLEPATDWEQLRQMTDAQIHTAIAAEPEIAPTDELFWQQAKVILPRRKVAVTMRLDADLLAWFRQEKGYQTKINAILRTYMMAHSSPPQPPKRRALSTADLST
jgi:uncharacterized protein (DUF4415 family)